MSHITGWGYYWLFWAFLGFGLPEAYGLVFNTKDTLSWQFWGALEHLNFGHPYDFSDWTWLHYLLGICLLIGMVWLFGHLVFGIWR
jgi:hypothetical protein